MEEILPEDMLDEDTIVEEMDMDDDSDDLIPEEIAKLRAENEAEFDDKNWETVKLPEQE